MLPDTRTRGGSNLVGSSPPAVIRAANTAVVIVDPYPGASKSGLHFFTLRITIDRGLRQGRNCFQIENFTPASDAIANCHCTNWQHRNAIAAEDALIDLPNFDRPQTGIWAGFIPSQAKYEAVYAAAAKKNVLLVNEPIQHQTALEFDRYYPYLIIDIGQLAAGDWIVIEVGDA